MPEHLDGSHGTNRNRIHTPQITVNTDIEAIQSWLAHIAKNQATFSTYRKESERLLLWATIELGKPFSSLNHGDFMRYEKFLLDPKPEERWLMQDNWKPSRKDKEWRPFATPLSEASQKQAMNILNTMLSWLVTAGYLTGNPLALSRSKRSNSETKVTRYLESDLWEHVKWAIMAMPQETLRDRKNYYRARWLFTLLFLGGLRISEVILNSMGCFRRHYSSDRGELWWLEIVGKGSKIRSIPASDELMAELGRYRQEHGLFPQPTIGESTPLLLPIRDDAKGSHVSLSRNAVHVIVKGVFKQAAKHIEAKGPEYAAMAATVRSASAHWLRHTAATNMANHIHLTMVRDNLGHSELATTNRYLHTQEEERHEQTTMHHRMKW